MLYYESVLTSVWHTSKIWYPGSWRKIQLWPIHHKNENTKKYSVAHICLWSIFSCICANHNSCYSGFEYWVHYTV